MKTQVIHLEPQDDLISIRDRMAWAKTPRILLVWPKRGRVDVRPIDLALLRRQAEALGAQLGLVTREAEIRAAAHEAGISLFSSAAAAQKKQWLERSPAQVQRRFPRADLRAARRDLSGRSLFPWLNHPIFRVVFFTLGVLSVLAVMLVFIPSAEVRLVAPEEQQQLVFSVSAEPGLEKVQVSGAVPARLLTLTVSGKASALGTGQVTLPDQTATGECLFSNRTEKVVTVPAGTILLTASNPPVAFVTLDPVDVPAKKAKKTISTPVRAVSAGSGGNVPAGAIGLFEGSLGLSLIVLNPNPTNGGSDLTQSVPTDQDRESLRKRLLTDLEREARGRFPALISAGDVLMPSSLARIRVVEETFSPPPGQLNAKVSLTMQVEYSMAYTQSADLYELAGRVLDASLPAGFEPLAGPLKLQMVSALTEDQGGARWQMRAERKVRPVIDAGRVISIVMGKTAGRAGSLLTETYRLTQSPEIRISPPGWPWLPFLPMQIRVISS